MASKRRWIGSAAAREIAAGRQVEQRTSRARARRTDQGRTVNAEGVSRYFEQRPETPIAAPSQCQTKVNSRGQPVLITLNGESFELDQPLSVEELLQRLEIDPRRVAVEHNLVILKRHAFAATLVGDGDRVEIVNFVGGG